MALPDTDASANWGIPLADDEFGVEDPTTEQSATQFNEMACDVSMMTHTARRAIVHFTAATYTSGTQSLTVTDHDAVWGSDTSVKPTVGQTSAGAITVTWAATQTDELGDSHTVNIRFPDCKSHGATNGYARVISWTANTITIQLYSTADAANALNGNTIAVWF